MNLTLIKARTVSLLLLATAFTAGAQDLHQDIEIERDIEPVEHDVNKLNITPAISLPPLHNVKLSLNERAIATSVTPLISFLEPASYADSLYVSPYRGYVAGGICPMPFNMALSAGYRLVDTDRIRLSVWGQFDSENYKRDLPWLDGESRYWRENTATAGLDLRWSIGKKSLLKAAVDYTFDRYKEIYQYSWILNTPPVNPRYYQSLNLLNVDVDFSSHVGGLYYNAGVRVNHTGTRRGSSPTAYFINDDLGFGDAPAMRQTSVDLTGDASLAAGENSTVSLDLAAQIIHSSPYLSLNRRDNYYLPGEFTRHDAGNRALFTILPRYTFDNNKVKAAIGARLQFSSNSGKVVNLTPDVNLGWTPMSLIAIDARVTGGVETNTLDRLYGVCHYFDPSVGYNFSRVPLDASGRITIGPWRGAYIELSAGYSMARRWLMPISRFLDDPTSTVMFAPGKIDGWRYGAAIGYNWRDKAIARVEYTGVPGDDSPEKGYYLWRDRARHQFKASVTVKPISRLSINADYTLRTGRRIIDRYEFNYTASPDGVTIVTRVNPLANSSMLNLGADYDFSDRLNLFVRGENLLDRYSCDIAMRPDAGLAIYLGASWLF